jgi:hypothetical protein
MGTGRRLAGTAVFALFVGALVARPILSNPAIRAAFDGGLSGWTALLALPVALVGLLLVALRLGWLSGAESTQPESDYAPDSHGWADDTRTGWDTEERDDGGESDDDEESDDDIEAEPPDASLGEHLDHLRAELDDREAASDLDTLEEVVETVEDERIPDRCPQEYCDAIWTERTVLGVKNGRYEVLEDGQTIVCLNCEETVTVE